MSQVVTRFAPSPTGFLHIGGARTALFNWLYAKRFGGTFLLRIEDTDRERSTEAAVDGDPRRAEMARARLGRRGDLPVRARRAPSRGRRADAGERRRLPLLCERRGARGDAPEGAARRQADALRRALARPRPGGGAAGRRARHPAARRPEGETIIDDKVQGKVVFANKELDDLVLLRSDGNPTYMLAVVVDDHDMGVTHVIRGDDHLTNAARQTQIYQALGWDVPVWAHIPLIHGPDGAKLSKRHGALGVDAYRALGYLPEALRNYLVRLGWSHGDKEFFTDDGADRRLRSRRVGRSPSRFDFAKLENMNGHFMRATGDAGPLRRAHRHPALSPRRVRGRCEARRRAKRAQLRAAIPGLKERAKTLVELLDGAGFLFAARPLAMDERRATFSSTAGAPISPRCCRSFAWSAEWSAAAARARSRAYAEDHRRKLGVVAQPLRAALTGRSTSPGSSTC